MQVSDEARKAEQIDALLQLVHERAPAAERSALEVFAREYYRQVAPEDVAARTPAELYGALMSHWQFARKREPHVARVRVLSPTIAEHGWSARHSVIEVVNDDMPFLVDSASAEINRQGLTLHQIIHPIYSVRRDAKGVLAEALPRSAGGDLPRESFMHIEVDRLVDPAARARLAEGIERILADVRAAVDDWKPMRARLLEVTQQLATATLPAGDRAEAVAFLEWLADEHLLLLGYRMQDLSTDGGEDVLRLVPGSGLGVLRDRGASDASSSFAALPPAARTLAHAPLPALVVTKANTRSTVHRPAYIDYVGVKRYDAAGTVIGEHRFVGLFTSTVYMSRVGEIPLVRGKVEQVIARAGLAPGGHLGKALQHILESYPRDELFQIDADSLYETAIGILQLGERQRFRLFLRRDPFDRFVSCLIFVPRENYSTDLRRKFQSILIEAFDGSSADFDVLLTDAVLARIHITVRTTPGRIPVRDRRELETRLAGAARRWDDDLRDALVEDEGEARGLALFKRYASGFPAAYREQEPVRAAVADLRKIEVLETRPHGLALTLYRPLEGGGDTLGFKIYHAGRPVVLSDSLPMLEHMGVRALAEHPYQIAPAGGVPLWLHDFLLELKNADEIDIGTVAPLFEDAFERVFAGSAENDDFNRLVLGAGLAAEEIVVLRAYARYMRQIGFALSQAFVEQTLTSHPAIARFLVRLFQFRLDPHRHDDEAARLQVEAIGLALEKVANLNEDRVLRQFLALIQATTRTNYWRTDGEGARRGFVSFKFDPARVPGLPEPRPMFEIFVYSPRFEGIHLRGGKVARGGLRWSDRPEDFRTEVLGLVKAQMVKNTVIVPVGSKGGFVLKKAPPASEREAFLAYGVACYQDFLRGLLDLTDNLVGGKVVPPRDVRRHDGDDPYLVVAADKGTASFSDYANAVSKEYGFWLGDAFASGGSVGYDHKKMGITARGAWESVKRHFRGLGIDTQSTDFTVVGIGDMSGDVFGNGMLLSPHIRLLAAFDHRHVFIDPDPAAASSFAERQRLFALPRSSWADYDAQLISAGGGVWPRSAKSIPVSPQARAALGIEADSLPPNELISALLKAPVDLLYNGGIGTYVKASGQTHAEVGDRANDGPRVDGRDLRCKVVGEGGNLGFTQLGRVEYALAGGRIFTDAIDNSAGVDTSDHEVNLKILLSLPLAEGELTDKQRNAVLAEMTDEVAALVLADNYAQTQLLSIDGRVAARLLEPQARFIRWLEKHGRLNRALEFLPSDEEIATRKTRGIGLTAPGRAVLMAYAKMWLSDELLASDLPEDPWVAQALQQYFPTAMRARFAPYIERHPLRREIIATVVLNDTVNRAGPTFVQAQMDGTGATAPQAVRAYLLAREVFALPAVWQAIEALDARVDDAVQSELMVDLRRSLTRASGWFLRSRRLDAPMGETIARFAPAVDAVAQVLADAATADSARGALGERRAAWVAAGVPAALAQRVAMAETLVAALDIAEIAEAAGHPVADIAAAYFRLGETLELARLRAQITALPNDSHWASQARSALRDDLADLQRVLTADAVKSCGRGGAAAITKWEGQRAAALAVARRMLDELVDARNADLAMLSVALRALRKLA